jgi:PAS domain S-box-containing protein
MAKPRDVNRHLDAEAALRESEERFRTLADNIAQFAWMADATGWIFWYNRRWYDYTGTSLEEMQGWGWTKAHHPDHVERVVERIKRSWETGEPWEDTFPLRSSRGQYRWFLSRALPILDERGRIVRWFGTNTDVTEQREAEELLAERTRALEVALEQRQSALELREVFLATLAHDLKAPLASLMWHAQILRRRLGAGRLDPIALDEALEAILSGATQAVGTIDELHDLTQLTAGGSITLHREPLDLSRLINQLASGPVAAAHEVRVEPIDSGICLYADRERLSRVAGNLLDNAAKYSRPGTLIVVRTETQQIDGATWAVIRVEDHGRGIPAADLPHVFERRRRGGNAADTAGEGIGLASVLELVRLHGGSVEVESSEGLGSTFTVRLPDVLPAAQKQ